MKADVTDEMTIGRLAGDPGRVLGTEASDSTLHYCSPAHGGWGVVRTALLVPETYLLFACPAACGRHGAIAAIEQGYKDRVGYLCLEEDEIVLGGYEPEIERGVGEALAALKAAGRAPRALMLCVSCIDDLLATDHEAALARLEAEHGLPVRLARMNPIMIDGKLPPAQRIQRTMYEFLEPATDRDAGVLLLGSFVPPARSSELARLVSALGLGPLRHPSFYDSLEEFRASARSRRALVLRPEGAAAAAYAEERLGISCLAAPVAYSEALVAERYRAIVDFLLPVGAERALALALARRGAEEAAAAAERAARALLGARVAVDSTVSASPFDLALALVEAGVDVERIYAERLPAHERASFDRLARLRPGLVVSNPSHMRRHAGRPERPLADVALGFAAAYASGAPRTVPLAFDEGLYGYEGRRLVMEALEAAGAGDAPDLESQVRDYGLVV